jgi:DNA polymerase V
MKYYLCIDLKSFYASVECSERNLDPFKTNLVVADKTRGKGTICLAITPKMKSLGIKNRCRIYEIPKNVKYIIAKPRMRKYMEYSYRIYEIYLKYVSKDDIHVYSIDEAFLDITPYIKLYKKNPKEIAIMIMNDIFKTTRITATCGIGTNMYLSKIALDIISKHVKSNIGFLNEKLYKEKLWHHTPLSDFWQIGVGIENRLHKMHIKDMYDISVANENKLYKEFGINAKLLIDHSLGIENCTIKDIKNYKPKSSSISNSQILFKDYNYKDAKVILVEMIDNLVLRLVSKNLYTNVVGFSIGYSKNIIDKTKFSKKLDNPTNSFIKIKNILLEEYDLLINEKTFIRKISIWFSGLTNKKIEQLNMFDNNNYNDEDKLERALNNLKLRYGKNVILRGISYTESGTQLPRNKLIGGHNAE